MKKVSIALCTYNGEKFIVEQLDSIVKQDYSNIEIIVSDDCSTDNTVNIVEAFSKNCTTPIHLYKNNTGVNLGFIKNFEKAIYKTTGDFIALSDHDDIWVTHKISTLVNKIKDNILIYSDSEIVDSNGNSLNKKLSDTINFVKGNDYRKLIFNNCVSGHAMMFKKELINKALPIPKVEFHDWWIAYTAMVVGNITYIKKPLVKFRLHSSNSSETAKNAVSPVIKKKKNSKKSGKSKNKWGAFKNNRKEILKLKLYKSFNYNDAYNSFFKKFILLTKTREDKFISFNYFLFWAKHGVALQHVAKSKWFKKYRIILKKVIGMKAKKIFYTLRNKPT